MKRKHCQRSLKKFKIKGKFYGKFPFQKIMLIADYLSNNKCKYKKKDKEKSPKSSISFYC